MVRTVKISGVRKGIADRLAFSMRTSIPVTLMTTFQADNLFNAYRQMKSVAGDMAPSITSILVHICSQVLRKWDEFNAIIEGDEIKIMDEVNIAVAVDTPRGLFAPVIRNADRLKLAEIELALRSLTEKAVTGKITYGELSGHTFTITNLGSEGVTYFTPVINPPAISILGVGTIQKSGEGMIGHLSLVFDHRAVDGAPAARFLAEIRKAVESFTQPAF
ncbi:Dihydrolipoyllysine-residue acetyltransferase component of pyruvate dehydrogenase complex [archaeon HR01]|nr:Dihydrolipoyllysine-residue acetyltransferase component of pyruvate dehydrogenase complex [archaeon HR01]